MPRANVGAFALRAKDGVQSACAEQVTTVIYLKTTSGRS